MLVNEPLSINTIFSKSQNLLRNLFIPYPLALEETHI